MSGVIGIDVGALDSVVGVCAKGQVDIVRNSVSERKTPSVIGFKDTHRCIGESGITQIKSNIKNTVRYPQNLIHSEGEIDPNDKFFQGVKFNGTNALVHYMDRQEELTPEQVMAMLITRLHTTSEQFSNTKIKDIVLVVPSYFNDAQRRRLMGAVEIANLHCIGLINEHAAIALAYGIYRSSDFSEKDPVYVCFVDFGHTKCNVSVASFIRGKLTICAERSNNTLCAGRALDKLIMDYIDADFQKKNGGMSLYENPKSKYRLEEAVSRGKKTLSTNDETNISIECVIEDIDLSVTVTREVFENLMAPMATALDELINSVIQSSHVPVIHSTEVVGGCTRIPLIENTILNAMNNSEITSSVKTLSHTLNADEVVAKGSALHAAILSPIFKVRPFAVEDVLSNHVIEAMWIDPSTNEQFKNEIFNRKTLLGSTKVITFNRSQNFSIDVNGVGTYAFQLPQDKVGKDNKVKIKCKIDLAGVFHILSAHVEETETYTTMIKEKRKKTDENMTDEGDDEKKEEYEEIEVPVEKTRDVQFTIEILPPSQFKEYREKIESFKTIETNMRSQDDLIDRINQSRNDLESFIYEARDKFDQSIGVLSPYVSPQNLEFLSSKLLENEEFIYSDEAFNEVVSESKFVDRLLEMKNIADRAQFLFNERQNILQMIADGVNRLNEISTDLANNSLTTEHQGEEAKKVIIKIEESISKISKNKEELGTTELFNDMPITTNDLKTIINNIEQDTRKVKAIKPPKKPEPEKKAENDSDMKDEETPKEKETPVEESNESMEVD